MANKNSNYTYSENRKEEVFNVIGDLLSDYVSNDYLNNLKAMADDQIDAMKRPEFIGQTLFDFINYDSGCHDINISDDELANFKRALIETLKGEDQNGL